MISRYAVRFFVVLGLLLGCQSKSKLAEPSSSPKTSLENLADVWETYLKDIHEHEPMGSLDTKDEVAQLCEQNENLCEHRTKGSRKKDRLTKDHLKVVKNQIQEGQFDELANYSVEFGLKLFSRYKDTELLETSNILLSDKSCKTLDLKHALASMLEDLLPEALPKEKAIALYTQNSLCSNNRTGALSAYRGAMLQLVDHNCSAALPLLERVSLSSEDYLKPRSLYWSWKCNSPTANTNQQQITPELPYFSYHRLLIENETQKSEDAGLTEKTPVLLTTSRNLALNRIIRIAEKYLSENAHSKARSLLEKIKVERVFETEPEFQVYWAFLLHQSQAGIRKFQILSNLVNRYPHYRSKIVKNMLFPTWYFEHVEASSRTLDPWLVQALIRQESAFDPHARSRVGATGLMQLMPGTARRIARIGTQKLKDPAQNVQVGIKFLEHLMNRFDGQVHLALAAYNAGPGRVEEWVKRYPTDDSMLFVDVIPYRETREYVAFILRNYHWYKSLNVSVTPDSKLTSDFKSRFAETPRAY